MFATSIQPPRDGWATRRRVSGLVGIIWGALTVLGVGGTFLVHSATTSWLFFCGGELFGLALLGLGAYYLFNEG